MKKIFVSLTLISFLNLIGCYYQEQMNPSEYNFDEKEELHLTTKDTTYNIGEKDYYLKNDTLFVTFRQKLDRQTTIKTLTEIPIKDIKSVEMEKTNTELTILATLGVTFGGIVVLFVLNGLTSDASIINR